MENGFHWNILIIVPLIKHLFFHWNQCHLSVLHGLLVRFSNDGTEVLRTTGHENAFSHNNMSLYYQNMLNRGVTQGENTY